MMPANLQIEREGSCLVLTRHPEQRIEYRDRMVFPIPNIGFVEVQSVDSTCIDARVLVDGVLVWNGSPTIANHVLDAIMRKINSWRDEERGSAWIDRSVIRTTSDQSCADQLARLARDRGLL